MIHGPTSMNWDEAVTFALALPDTELGRTYGQSAVKIRIGHRFKAATAALVAGMGGKQT